MSATEPDPDRPRRAPATSGMTLQVPVPSDDMAAARAFYSELFAGPPHFEPHDDFLEWAPMTGQECWFQVVGSPGDRRLRNRVRFRVMDIAVARDWLMLAGVECTGISRLPGTVAFLDFDDPWGNSLGYYQDLASNEQQATYPGTSVHDGSLYRD